MKSTVKVLTASGHFFLHRLTTELYLYRSQTIDNNSNNRSNCSLIDSTLIKVIAA